MPIYSYKCPICDERYEDVQTSYTGTRPIHCPNKCKAVGIHGIVTRVFVLMDRDYSDEKPFMLPDWEPGYNIGIDYQYSSKGDLYREMQRRGLRGKRMDGSIQSSRVKPGLYGDEEFKDMYTPTSPENKPVLEEVE